MRRLAILLVPIVSTVGAAMGTVLTAAPAHADTSPLVQVTATVLPPPQPTLLSLCITSHSLDPNGTCIII